MQDEYTTDGTYLRIQGRGSILLGAVQEDESVKILATFERLTPEEVDEVVELLQLGLQARNKRNKPDKPGDQNNGHDVHGTGDCPGVLH